MDVALAAAASNAPPTRVEARIGGVEPANDRLRLRLETGSGPAIREARLLPYDTPPGAFTPTLHVVLEPDRPSWLRSDHVHSATGFVSGGIAIANSIAQVAGPGGVRVQVACRLHLPPGIPAVLCALRSVRNIGDTPIRLRGPFFHLQSAFHGRPSALPRNVWRRPPSDAWVDESSGLFWGAVAPPVDGLKVDFWIDRTHGTRHSDARWELTETVISPGAEFIPASPVYVAMIGDRGGASAWLQMVVAAGQWFE